MNKEELHEKMTTLFKTKEEFCKAQEKNIDKLLLKYDPEDLLEAAVEYKTIHKRCNFFDFVKECEDYIIKIKNKIKYTSEIIDKRVPEIMIAIIDAIEVRTQQYFGNKEITCCQNRYNYKHPGKLKASEFNEKAKSFVMDERGKVEIKDDIESTLSNMFNNWSWLNLSEEVFAWVVKMKIDSVLRVVLSDMYYFNDGGCWYKNIIDVLNDNEALNQNIVKEYNNDNKISADYNKMINNMILPKEQERNKRINDLKDQKGMINV